MRVFVTGATGFVGSAVTRDLIGAGHEVVALTRSAASAQRARQLGAEPAEGSLERPEGLRRAAQRCDAVVHTAFDNRSLWRFPLNSRVERAALAAMGEVLAGSAKPLVAAGGFAPVRGGVPLLESDRAASSAGFSGRNVERTIAALADRGVNASVVRMPCVHGPGDHFTLARLIALARRHGRSPWVGDGANRLPAVAVGDAARVYRLAVEAALPGVRYHAVGEEGLTFRCIAEAIGHHLGVPALGLTRREAMTHFGPLLPYVMRDAPASNAWTCGTLGWFPQGPGLEDDLASQAYLAPPAARRTDR